MDNNMIHHKFRTSALGGFKRKDVAAYIESSSAEYNQQIKQLQDENSSLSARNDELSGMLLEMEQRLKTARASLEAVTREKDELSAMLDELTSQAAPEAEPEVTPDVEPSQAEDAVHPSGPVCVPVIKAPKSSVKNLPDSIRKPESEAEELDEIPVEAPVSEEAPEIIVESPEGKELLASIKIYYPR